MLMYLLRLCNLTILPWCIGGKYADSELEAQVDQKCQSLEDWCSDDVVWVVRRVLVENPCFGLYELNFGVMYNYSFISTEPTVFCCN